MRIEFNYFIGRFPEILLALACHLPVVILNLQVSLFQYLSIIQMDLIVSALKGDFNLCILVLE